MDSQFDTSDLSNFNSNQSFFSSDFPNVNDFSSETEFFTDQPLVPFSNLDQLLSLPLSPLPLSSPIQENLISEPQEVKKKARKVKCRRYKHQIQTLILDPSMAGKPLQCAKRLKRVIEPAIAAAFDNSERVTIYVVPQSCESSFSPTVVQDEGFNHSKKRKSCSTATSKKLKKLFNYLQEVQEAFQREESLSITHENIEEEEDHHIPKPASRSRKVSPAPSPPVISTLYLPLLIYTRIKHQNRFCPENKLYAILHRLHHPTEEKGHKRYGGSIFVPLVQKNIEPFWDSLSNEQRLKWSLDERNCPFRLRKFSEVVKYTMSHPPFSYDPSSAALLTSKELPPGPKSWYVCHPSFQQYRISIVDCAPKIVSNARFNDNPNLNYGALSKGKIKGPLRSIHIPSELQSLL